MNVMVQVGTFAWYKNNGAFLEIDDYTYSFGVGFKNGDFPQGAWSSLGAYDIIPSMSDGVDSAFLPSPIRETAGSSAFGYLLMNSDIEQGVARVYNDETAYFYTQVIPWNCYYKPGEFWWNSQAATWAEWVRRGNFTSDQEHSDGVLWGHKVLKPAKESIISLPTDAGQTATIIQDKVWGTFEQFDEIVFPDRTIKQQFEKSNITGSFTWKGDPRMQPRDVVEWERLDGTTTTITLENITLTHEGGGTSAEITYREGVV